MSARDRDVRARAALHNVHAPACHGAGALWNTCEAAHLRAASREAAQAAAEPLIDLCTHCPALAACQEWASTEAYTGIAGASAWVDGRPRAVDLVHSQGDPSTQRGPRRR